jgi:hypothetical protein
MRYLCLIVWDEDHLAQLPPREIERLNAAHLALNEELLASGHFIEAEPLEGASMSTCLRVRGGRVNVTDGPFAETKEQVAGFYLLEARDLNEALQPPTTATTVSVRDGQRIVTDGPFAETKEQLGGYFLLEAPSLDDAIEAAARIPGARTGRVEVRPIAEIGG